VLQRYHRYQLQLLLKLQQRIFRRPFRSIVSGLIVDQDVRAGGGMAQLAE
jgi:hypothetical protein